MTVEQHRGSLGLDGDPVVIHEPTPLEGRVRPISPTVHAVHDAGPDGYRLGRRPALNGVRGLAVIAVVLSHSYVPYTSNAGSTGVVLFFVLSGFLITRLLAEERQERGRADLRAFYVRRAARLFPALVLFLPVAAIVLVARGDPLWPVLASALYSVNFALASGVDMSFLGHLWSLSLEEQFYLLWPAVLLVLASRRRLIVAVLAVAALSVLWRGIVEQSGASLGHLFYGPDTRLDALLLGCALALVIQRIHVPGWVAATGGTILLASALVPSTPTTWTMLPAALSACGVVGWAAQTNSTHLSWRPLALTGVVSYGIYIWHYPVTEALHSSGFPWWVTLGGALAACAIAVLSWRTIEQPAAQWARLRLASAASKHRPSGPAGHSG